ncbi:MAG: LysR family transcriptional regulator [Eubacterium sp.]|nr:LysR family transcriptional regulator [Eubacterium sp.]
MTLDQLTHFTAAATELNLSRAAEKLYISHSAISRSISSLEKELGTTLLNRSSRSVSLTKAGSLLYMRASKLLEEFDRIQKDVKDLGKSEREILRFSSAIPYSEKIMKHVQIYKSSNPNVEMVFRSTTPYQATFDLLDGRCDICITYSFSAPAVTKNLERIKLEDGNFVFITSVDNKLSKRKSIRVNEISKHLANNNSTPPIIPGFSRSQPHSLEEALYKEMGVEDIFFSVRMNMESVVIPEHSTAGLDERCVCIPISGNPEDIGYQIYLYYDLANPNPALKSFFSTQKQ